MSRKFETTFSVAVPVARAWEAFTEPDELSVWTHGMDLFEARPGGRVRYELEGYPTVEGTVEEVEENRRLRWTEGPGILPGTTEITVVFEAIEGGTRITLTHAGFGEGEDWLGELDGHAHGWGQILADLALYLETGVRLKRAFTQRSRIGVAWDRVPAGLRVLEVVGGTFAEEAGVLPGDLLVEIGGAGVFDVSDLWLVGRLYDPGAELEAAYVRDGRLLRGRGRLTPTGLQAG